MKKFLIILIIVFILTLCVPLTSLISRNDNTKKSESYKNDKEIVTIFSNQ